MVDRLATGVPATLQHGASEPYAGWVTLSVDRAYLNLINLATERWRQSWVRRRPSFERKKARGEAESKPPLTVPQAMFWDTGLAFFGMLTVWLCSEERTKSIEFLLGHTKNPNSGWLALGMICASSTLAFLFNFATYYFILYTSALSSTIGSNSVKIFIIVASMYTDGVFDIISVSGVGLVVVSIVAYAYFQHQFKQQQAAGADKSQPLAAKADEKTPLAGTGKV